MGGLRQNYDYKFVTFLLFSLGLLIINFSFSSIRATEDFTASIQQEHTLSQDEMMTGIKKGILRGFLELDEKLRKIPEVGRSQGDQAVSWNIQCTNLE